MFPNIRLMIVAIGASIVGICCGLGMFAAFRVNHEPFTRWSGGSPPLQLAFGNAEPASVTDAVAAPFGVRFQVNALPTAGAAVNAATLAHGVGAEAPTVAPAVGPAAEPATANAASSDATGNVTTEMPAPAAPDSDAGQNAEPDTHQNGTGNVALESPADQLPPAASAAPAGKPVPAGAASTVVKPTAAAAPEAVRHRVAKVRRIRKTPAATAAQSPEQNFTFAPNYQSLPQAAAQPAGAPQVVKRRVAKRHRPVKQTAKATTA